MAENDRVLDEFQRLIALSFALRVDPGKCFCHLKSFSPLNDYYQPITL
ncbi:MAG: hypothetical protein ACK5VS_16240 [Hyphomonadaceae bacterium]